MYIGNPVTVPYTVAVNRWAREFRDGVSQKGLKRHGDVAGKYGTRVGRGLYHVTNDFDFPVLKTHSSMRQQSENKTPF